MKVIFNSLGLITTLLCYHVFFIVKSQTSQLALRKQIIFAVSKGHIFVRCFSMYYAFSCSSCVKGRIKIDSKPVQYSQSSYHCCAFITITVIYNVCSDTVQNMIYYHSLEFASKQLTDWLALQKVRSMTADFFNLAAGLWFWKVSITPRGGYTELV